MSYAGVDYSDAYYRDRAQEKAAGLEDELKRMEKRHKQALMRARASALREARDALQDQYGDDAQWVCNWLSLRAAGIMRRKA